MITKLQVKYIQSLGQKKFRDQAGVFVAEGPKIINEWLDAGHASLETLYATRAWMETQTGLLQNMAAEKVVEVKEPEMERLSFLQTPHAVLGVFRKPTVVLPDFSRNIFLMLDGIQDPGNLGTLIRIADWFGISHIICSADCADAFAPKVVQAAMGSLLRVQLLYTDLLQLVTATRSMQLYAATLNGQPVNSMPPLQNGVIVIGNESKGIRPALLDSCQHRITIPRLGQAESLNAGVAAGIVLSHLLRKAI
ncbi:MAG: RNA methyltransferase [Bacteroidota bacterium]